MNSEKIAQFIAKSFPASALIFQGPRVIRGQVLGYHYRCSRDTEFNHIKQVTVETVIGDVVKFGFKAQERLVNWGSKKPQVIEGSRMFCENFKKTTQDEGLIALCEKTYNPKSGLSYFLNKILMHSGLFDPSWFEKEYVLSQMRVFLSLLRDEISEAKQIFEAECVKKVFAFIIGTTSYLLTFLMHNFKCSNFSFNTAVLEENIRKHYLTCERLELKPFLTARLMFANTGVGDGCLYDPFIHLAAFEESERERIERERIEQELEQERIEKERLEKIRIEQERLEKERQQLFNDVFN